MRGCSSRLLLGFFACTLAVVSLAGCNDKVVHLGSSTSKLDEFLQSDKPVVVDFYKTLCPPCSMVDPIIDRLADEYDGQVSFGRFTIMNFFLIITNWEVHKRYGIGMVPTVILFVKGEEKHRWVLNLDTNSYRKVLDEYRGHSATQPDSPVTGNSPSP